MIERVVSAGRHELPAANCRTLSPSNERVEHPRLPGWNRRAGDRPRIRAAPEEAGAARAEQPFVRASREEVAPELGEVQIFDTQTVDAVDAQINATLRPALLVGGRDRSAIARIGIFRPVPSAPT